MEGAGIEVLDLVMVIATSELAASGVKGEVGGEEPPLRGAGVSCF